MPPESHAIDAARLRWRSGPWMGSLARLVCGSTLLFVLTITEWREMAHQWWNIDTYGHIVLVPPILGWLVWLRRSELARIAPEGWAPGLAALAAGLAIWLTGREMELNLAAQVGAVISLQGAVVTLLGARATLILAFPLFYALFLVPFGDEIVAPLQEITARIAVVLTHASGVPAVAHGLYIDTPAGRFVVAEECSGVKFLIAMTALATLVAWTGFRSWKRRAWLVVGAAAISIVANGVRAWGTIHIAQYIGAERAGSFDHIVYGWVFFAVIIALVLTAAWRFFEREPAEAGLSAAEADALASRMGGIEIAGDFALALIAGAAFAFAVVAGVL